MPRQLNEMSDKEFDYCGEIYSLVEKIHSLEELAEAQKILDILRSCVDSYEPDSGHPCFWMKNAQEKVIKEYMDSVGEFDNTQFLDNLNFLLKINNIRVGELEQMLGISAGYISRTAKHGSAKKISIDVVWKIATLFNVSLQDLVEKDLNYIETNIEVIIRFLEKIGKQTEAHIVEWKKAGGFGSELETPFKNMPCFSEQKNDTFTYKYSPEDHLNPDIIWVLNDSIYYTEDIVPGKQLAILHYISADKTKEGYDFILLNPYGKWSKAFYSCDVGFGILNDACAKLMAQINDQEFDAILSHEVRSFINDYLREETE